MDAAAELAGGEALSGYEALAAAFLGAGGALVDGGLANPVPVDAVWQLHPLNSHGEGPGAFEVRATLKHNAGSSGYLISKGHPSGSRVFSVLFSRTRGLRLWYRIAGSTAMRSASFETGRVFADGAQHSFRLAVQGSAAAFCVDDACSGGEYEVQALDGVPTDCDIRDPATCVLLVGARPAGGGSVAYPFRGTILALEMCSPRPAVQRAWPELRSDVLFTGGPPRPLIALGSTYYGAEPPAACAEFWAAPVRAAAEAPAVWSLRASNSTAARLALIDGRAHGDWGGVALADPSRRLDDGAAHRVLLGAFGGSIQLWVDGERVASQPLLAGRAPCTGGCQWSLGGGLSGEFLDSRWCAKGCPQPLPASASRNW